MSDTLSKYFEKIPILTKQAKGFLLDPKADKAIAILIDYKEQIENVLKAVKEEVVKQGEAQMEGFRSVAGEHVMFYKTNGGKRIVVDFGYVRKYQDKYGKLPEGVMETESLERLVFRKKK